MMKDGMDLNEILLQKFGGRYHLFSRHQSINQSIFY